MNLVAPTDKPLADLLGWETSSLPEKYGADVLANGLGGLVGIQRKEFWDLLASVRDGRLQREVKLLQDCEWPALIVEGWGDFTTDGYLLGYNSGNWTVNAIDSLLRAVQWQYGIMVERTVGINYTAERVRDLVGWAQAEHKTLERLPKSSNKGLGKRSHQQEWILQAFPGVSDVRAKAIMKHFNRVPLKWDADRGELMEVEGLGKVTVDGMIRILE